MATEWKAHDDGYDAMSASPSAARLAGTSRWTAAERAVESRRADRLFADPLADVLAGEEGVAWVMSMGGQDRFRSPAVAVRTRFFDDLIVERLRAADSPAQVVALGAGMDSRPYRLALPERLVWFEVDRPDLVAEKQRIMAANSATSASCEVRRVGADLTGGWERRLTASGFDPNRPTIWLVEGVVMYLQALDGGALLDAITSLSAAPGSILCDVIGQQFLDSPLTREWLDALEAAGVPWVSGSDRPGAMFGQRGWIPEIRTLADVAREFGRWPFPVSADSGARYPDSFLIHAMRP